MDKPNRVLVIGLDGGTWDVLEPWIADGSLPNLSRLRQSGCWGNLHSTIPPITAPAWSTFMTGKRPGKHGVFHFIPIFSKDEPSDNQPKIVNARNIQSSTLWDIMGHHDRKVVLINVPMTYPPRSVNGLMISCFLTPKGAPIFTYPPELMGEIDDYIIDLDRFIDIKPYQGKRDHTAVLPTLSMVNEFGDMLEKRAKTSLSLMRSKPWDFFMVVFTGTDRLGHYLWPYHHITDTGDTPEIKELSRSVYNYYIRLDEIVGELAETAGDDVTIIVMSDHGMGTKNTKWVHGNNWLRQRGWLDVKIDRTNITNLDGLFGRLRLPRDKIGRFVNKIPGLSKSRLVEKAAASRSAMVDIEHSQAYLVPIYRYTAGIYINLDGDNKEILYEAIVRGLEEIIDSETGECVIQEICRGEEYYHGPFAEHIPDIIVILKPDYNWNDHVSSYSSFVTRVSTPSEDGDHRLEGIFMATGPGIIPNPQPLPSLYIEDLAPTILYLMGLPCPTDLDGRVLNEVVVPGELDPQLAKSAEPVGFWPKEEVVFLDQPISNEEEEEIRARLQALGYLD